MKKVKTLIGKSGLIKGVMTLVLMASVFYTAAFMSLAASGKVTADTAKIRAEASTDSEVVGSTVKGKTIDILDAVKDSSGTVWYKVSVTGGGYGYIRSDLVETSDSIEVSSSSSSESVQSTSQSEQTQKPEETIPTSIGEQQATIQSTGSVRIRSGASTAHDAVTSLPNGTVITLIGEANDSAGNKWYQMTCDYNGKTVEGYVRSDLIAIGAPQTEESSEGGDTEGENAEGESAEGETGAEGENTGEEEVQQEPEEEHNDYEIVYAEDPNTGESIYWLHDNVNKERQRLSELLGVAGAANDNIQKLQDQVDKEKIVIIILAVVIVVLFIIITVLALKIRSLYYEDYDEDYDEEEEEEEEEPAPVKKKVKKQIVQEEEEDTPVRKKKQVAKEEPQLYAAERKESPARETTAKKPAARKSQNFLIDDDEFEFEFLNMDDKDL